MKLYQMPRHADRYFESQLPLAEPLPVLRNLGWFLSGARAFRQRHGRLINFVVQPFVILLLLGVVVKEELELLVERFNARHFDRVAMFAIYCLISGIAFLLAFDLFASMATDLYTWAVR